MLPTDNSCLLIIFTVITVSLSLILRCCCSHMSHCAASSVVMLVQTSQSTLDSPQKQTLVISTNRRVFT